MIRAAFLLALVALLIASARSFLPAETSLVGSGAALAFGFVLLASLQTGTLFAGMRLPRLTGYLVCGFVAGPSVLDLVTERMLSDLRLVNGVAIGLIALSAGSELNFRRMRSKIPAIIATGSTAMAVSIVALVGSVLLFAPFLPFLTGMSLGEKLAVALTMAVVFTALSPAVALAIIRETGATGPVTEIVLGIVVLGDLVIVLAFAATNALASATFASGGGGDATMFTALAGHIVGSFASGALLGLGLTLYVRRVNQRIALFVVGVCFLAAEAGTRLHLDPLLICLTAGLFVENLTDIEGSALIGETEVASLPVFAVFFAVAGAGLHWDVFKVLAPVAAALAIIRGAALFGGARLGMSLARLPEGQRRYVPFGLLPQSGVAIGLCVLVAKQFPGWGDGASACLLGGVMVNEMIGPILLRLALIRAGEAGRRAVVESRGSSHG